MRQEYDFYKEEDFQVWKILFERQVANLSDKASPIYLECLGRMKEVMYAERIPRFEELDRTLMAANGWSIEVVPGLIPVKEFFAFLANKRFCASTWLRKMSELDYLEEPDMFHDIFGHIPLLMDQNYADFTQKLGELGVKYAHSDELTRQIQRIYWFTVEFGLIKGREKTEIYGAGIISSFGETHHIYDDPIEIRPFDLNNTIHQEFINSEIQQLYYECESFEQLYTCLGDLEALIA